MAGSALHADDGLGSGVADAVTETVGNSGVAGIKSQLVGAYADGLGLLGSVAVHVVVAGGAGEDELTGRGRAGPVRCEAGGDGGLDGARRDRGCDDIIEGESASADGGESVDHITGVAKGALGAREDTAVGV